MPSALALIVAGVTAMASAGGWPHRACLSLFLGLAFLVAWTFTNTAAPFNSTKTVGLTVAREYRPGDTLVIFRTAAQGLPFYTGPAPSPLLVGVTRETGFEEPGKTPPLLEEPLFRTLLTGPERVLVVTQEKRRAELPQLREIARGTGYLLLGNR